MNTRSDTYLNACEIKKRFGVAVIRKCLCTSIRLNDSYWIKVYSIALNIR